MKDNGENGGFGAAAGTPTTALYDATVDQGLAFDASWSSSLNDFEVSQVGEDIANSGENGEYWGYATNFTTAEVGGCQIRLAPGSEVLWAYDFFGLPHLLSLSGPTSVNVGTPFTVRVTDGQTGTPISGASVGQLLAGVTTPLTTSTTTDTNGDATVTLAAAGTVTLKATQPDSVRSNGLAVCAHNGNDGSCGTTTPSTNTNTGAGTGPTGPGTGSTQTVSKTDLAKVTGVENGHLYTRHTAPRLLVGMVQVPADGTLSKVRISLQRTYRGRCYDFSGPREKFLRAKCGVASFFSVGSTESFTYLLPSRLPVGRYAYEIQAIDAGGHATKPVKGVSSVVFRVG